MCMVFRRLLWCVVLVVGGLRLLDRFELAAVSKGIKEFGWRGRS